MRHRKMFLPYGFLSSQVKMISPMSFACLSPIFFVTVKCLLPSGALVSVMHIIFSVLSEGVWVNSTHYVNGVSPCSIGFEVR